MPRISAGSMVSEENFHNHWVAKPWGRESLFFENDDVAILLLEINGLQKTSMHCHPNKNTSLVILGGNAECSTLEAQYKFLQGQGIYLGKKVFHQTRNLAKERLYVLEVESPVDKFDLVRLEDDYGREKQGYEGKKSYVFEADLTIPSCPEKLVERKVSKSKLQLGFAKSLEDLKLEEHDVLTILNRHVWTTEGKKVLEVGQSLLFSAFTGRFAVNNGFYYLILKRDNT
jgi:mannose-6-phosphate isomerase-like protein (cupin superfamily)